MAVINTMKTIEQWRKNEGFNTHYDLYIRNIEDIYKNNTNVVEMIIDAFVFGYAQGSKAERKAQSKKVG